MQDKLVAMEKASYVSTLPKTGPISKATLAYPRVPLPTLGLLLPTLGYPCLP